jgi:anti-sigma regulatory factor (Ser/Thr protein kinase)
MALTGRPPLRVVDASQVGAARRAATDLAVALGFNENDVARVALVATEMASNLVKHAREGEMLLQTSGDAVELVALDRGPGIANIAAAMRDGMSTVGTPGTGLGAISRVASRFDVYSTMSAGTAVFAAVAPSGASGAAAMELGAVCVPYPGEDVCGDGVAVVRGEGRVLVLVTDGLGHGPLAAEASQRAAELLAAYHGLTLSELMQRLHDGLRPTRGAAAALAEVDTRRGVVRYCGIGNIAATIVHDGKTRSLMSHHGTLGHDARKIAELQYPWSADALLVLNSDGLVSSWTLQSHQGLSERAPSLIAAVLYRDHRRLRDDTTVVVLRGMP